MNINKKETLDTLILISDSSEKTIKKIKKEFPSKYKLITFKSHLDINIIKHLKSSFLIAIHYSSYIDQEHSDIAAEYLRKCENKLEYQIPILIFDACDATKALDSNKYPGINHFNRSMIEGSKNELKATLWPYYEATNQLKKDAKKLKDPK